MGISTKTVVTSSVCPDLCIQEYLQILNNMEIWIGTHWQRLQPRKAIQRKKVIVTLGSAAV